MVAFSSSNLGDSSFGDTSYWGSSDSVEGNPSAEAPTTESPTTGTSMPNTSMPSTSMPGESINKMHRKVQNRFSQQHSFQQQGSQKQSMSVANDESRFILWVDAVGGFLVCPRQEVTIGQAIAESRVDIPILGDLARRHLKIIRNPEGYLLEPFGYVKVNGDEIVAETSTGGPESEVFPKKLLRDGDVLELTGGIKIKFSKPHPLSATARLDFLSPHRTQPWSDAVLLMAESCVLGPHMKNHVVCRQWNDDLVFFQQKGQLFCKSLRPINVDGSNVDGKHELTRNSRIEGEDFSMTIEPLTS